MVMAVAVLACSSPTGEAGEITVFAASSLSTAFEQIAVRFEKEHPGRDVVLSFAGSQTLATQVVNGAPVDVFASADQVQMERALAAVPADVGPRQFATNRLTIVVAEGNPKHVRTVSDLARPDVVVVLGAAEVPVGRYTRRMLEAAGVEMTASSYEPNVGLVLSKVALGEADAGVVYQSDLQRTDRVEGVAVPDEVNVVAHYPIAGWGDGAEEFVDFVLSSEGTSVLTEAGFRP